MRIAFVFPGQGSQSVGMLSGFADNAVVADYMARANAALGEDLVKLIAEGPAEVLSLTVNTQPALLAASAAFYEAWIAAGGRRPDVMAGHSLGEYSALTSAGTFAFEDAVKLVRFRAQAMQEAVPVGVGGMAAVIGLDDEAVIEACREASAVGPVEPVNFNSPGQVVIAGRSDGLAKAVELLKARGCRRAIPLAVSGPFHSSLLAPAGERLAKHLAEVKVSAPSVPVYANVTAQLHTYPGRNPRAPRAAGIVGGAVDQDCEGHGSLRRHRHRGMRAGQSSDGARQAHCTGDQTPRHQQRSDARGDARGARSLKYSLNFHL